MGKRKSTKYPGVQARESEERRYKGRPDICYTIDYRDATGKRIRKDVGWASQGFSAALAAEMRARLVNNAKTAATLGDIPISISKNIPTFGEAWNIYKRDWLEANNKHTACDESMIKGVLKDIANFPLDKITAYRLDVLMSEMRQNGYAPQTIIHAISLIRRIINKMVKWKMYNGPLPFNEITLPKLNNERQRFLTPDEARILLAVLEKNNQRCWLMALISLHCGLRFGEIANLKWGDVHYDTFTIFVPDSKSGHARHAVMTEDVANALSKLPQGKPTTLVFPTSSGQKMENISKTFSNIVEAVGLNDGISDRRQKVVFHTLRHTYASWLAKSGQGQLTIADRLGHRSLDMTKRYTHLMDETRRASAEAISRMFHDAPPERQ